MSAALASPGTIEVFADLWCPFAHVGLREVVRQRHQLGRDDAVLRVRAWPLELINGEPMDFDRTEEHARDLAAQVAPGLFAGLRRDAFPHSTLEALALVEAAYRRDDRLGEVVSLRLRDALFEGGRDLSAPEELARLADELGSPLPDEQDRASVLASLEEGRARGVRGSPHFFCGADEAFCPALEMRRDEHGALRVALDPAAMSAFLKRCLGPGHEGREIVEDDRRGEESDDVP